MATQDILQILKAKADAALQDAQAEMQHLNDLETAIADEKKSAVDQAFLDGKASVVLPEEGTGEKLFTQDDMNRLAEQAKAEKAAELQGAIDAANAETSAVKAQAEADKLAAEQAHVDFKKEVARRIRDSQIDDLAIAAELEA